MSKLLIFVGKQNNDFNKLEIFLLEPLYPYPRRCVGGILLSLVIFELNISTQRSNLYKVDKYWVIFRVFLAAC